jgi:hypothetical protein
MSSGTRRNFEELVASASPALRPVCISLRRLIGKLHPKAMEITWPRQRIASFGIGPRKLSDHYCYIAVYSAHVNLGFYRGAALLDRGELLLGSGRRLRHISFRGIAATRRPAVAALLRAAIAERRRNARAAQVEPRVLA